MTPKKAKLSMKALELQHLGERIKVHRKAKALSQQSLAEAVRLSVAYISLIERGSRNPPYTTVVAIAAALDVPAARLVADL